MGEARVTLVTFSLLSSSYLKHHFNCEDTSEDIVKVVEYLVSIRLSVDGVLGSQRDGTRTDDDHDEQVKVAQVHHEVTKPPHPAKKKDENASQIWVTPDAKEMPLRFRSCHGWRGTHGFVGPKTNMEEYGSMGFGPPPKPPPPPSSSSSPLPPPPSEKSKRTVNECTDQLFCGTRNVFSLLKNRFNDSNALAFVRVVAFFVDVDFDVFVEVGLVEVVDSLRIAERNTVNETIS